VPEELYEIQIGKNRINWWNGAYMIYRPRVITGSRERARSKFRGIEFSFVIDDETAIGFDKEQYLNTLARIRIDSKCRYYFTLSTPRVGPYGRFIKRGGNKLFRGRTADNHYLLKRDPHYEENLREDMSAEQARRELDGELVALEGRIWKTAKGDVAWPDGNRNDNHTAFDSSKPWWLFCDLGSATGAYAVVQTTDPIHEGRRLYSGKVWVAVADYCPDDDASASRAFQRLKAEFGTPLAVVAGCDIGTRDRVSGDTVAYFAKQTWGGVQTYSTDESVYSRQKQYDRLSYMMCSANGARRFTIARDFVALDTESQRGVREMLDEDQWPPVDKRRPGDFLPKNSNIVVQHIRDALLAGAVNIMAPPEWGYSPNPAA